MDELIQRLCVFTSGQRVCKSGVVKDAFSLWLNQHTEIAEALAEMCINKANFTAPPYSVKPKRLRVKRSLNRAGTHQAKLTDCSSQDISYSELFLVEGDSVVRGASIDDEPWKKRETESFACNLYVQ